jgi:malonate-semialdehyde dehydrogenase (acetylating)/methylmalonate-semialdehyde dehydrogenase
MNSSPAVQAATAPTVKLLIDGKFVESKTTEWHDVIATQEVLAQVPFATDAEIEAAITSAKTAFKTRIRWPPRVFDADQPNAMH